MATHLTQEDLKNGLSSFIKSELQHSLEAMFRETIQRELQVFFATRASVVESKHSSLRKPSASRFMRDYESFGGEPRGSKQSFGPTGSKQTDLHGSNTSFPELHGSNTSFSVQNKMGSDGKGYASYTPLTATIVAEVSANETQDEKQSMSQARRSMRKSKRFSSIQDASVFDIVNSPRFGFLSGVMVLINAIVIGYDTNYRATNDNSEWDYANMFEILFCVFFSTEIGMRMYGLGYEFLCGDQLYWNLFDTLVVGCQVIEQVLTVACGLVHHNANFSTLRVLRILRIIRVVRVVRVLHLFEELRQIVGSMLSSFGVLMWSLLILFLMIYLFGVIFLQFILESGGFSHSEALQYYFCSLPRTIFTMFESIVGGVNWDDVAQPLITDVSPALAILFTFYVASAMFAIMNMLTGVFVEKAMMCVREDKDYKLAYQIRNLFFDEDDDSLEVDWDGFVEKTRTTVMREYLTELQISISETEGLFELLDVDNSGSVSATEIVDGCMRLRGPARALDLALLMREVSMMRAEIKAIGGMRP